MKIPLLVNGAKGKMGREIIHAFEHDNSHFYVAAATESSDDLMQVIHDSKAKIVIDFTQASVGFQNAALIIQAGVHPVIGTTGFLPDQIDELKSRCDKKKLGGIIAPNFSIGAILMMRFAEQAARYYEHSEIIEMHHATKEEVPSGTAIRTAELIATHTAGRKKLTDGKKYKEIFAHARGATAFEVPVHSVRLPGLVAHQTVMFGGRGEILTLRHDCLHRESFMPGIKLACQKVLTLNTLMYGLEHLI